MEVTTSLSINNNRYDIVGITSYTLQIARINLRSAIKPR